MDLMSLKSIYKEVIKDIDAVLQALETQSEDVELSKAIETARDSFAQLKNETDTILQELDKDAEWDVLTVALYGETNAGKSTIIEILRILVGEKTKQEQRRKFCETCNKFYIDENIVETWKRITSRADSLTAEINALPFWRHALSFAWKIPAKAELNAIDAAMKELERCQDGAIIGDGRSDFTRESTRYKFTANNGNKFVLLDVPGIEGKEEQVREPIMQAMRKAHAIFYVTRNAVPPQKGDEKTGQKGTLEKIKEHLGAQTEVWTIFNKSIKSAEPLRKPQLVNKGELDSLEVLEGEMRKQLGNHYAGLLCVSAYPAFVACTDHFLPGDTKHKDLSLIHI